MRTRTAMVVVAAIILSSSSSKVVRGQGGPDLSLLEAHNVKATVQGIKSFLKSLDPQSPIYRRRLSQAENWVRELGDDSFRQRELAHQALLTTPFLPARVLNEAARSVDAEVAWRAKDVITATSMTGNGRTSGIRKVVGAACRILVKLEANGATAELLSVMPFFDDQPTLLQIRKAIVATAKSSDQQLLRESLESKSPQIRIAALLSLSKFLDKDSIEIITVLLDDPSDDVRLFASQGLAEFGDRRALAGLVDLLSSEELDIRSRAGKLLRALTGQRFEFVAYDSVEKRGAAVGRWKSWLAESGANANLKLPIRLADLKIGRTLITDYGANRILEVDQFGKTIWQKEVNSPWGCQGLPNGHRVVSSYKGQFVVEFDADGKEVWRRDGLPGNGMGLHRLENGNTLVACSTSNQVVEYRRDGSLAWKAFVKGRPVDVRRLDNGRTLVALEASSGGQKIVEVDKKGEIVWEVANVNKPLSVERLDNGNTLVATASGNRLVEYDRNGKTAWVFETGGKATDAERLENGDTLFSSHGFVRLLDHNGKTKWDVSGLKYCYGIDHY